MVSKRKRIEPGAAGPRPARRRGPAGAVADVPRTTTPRRELVADQIYLEAARLFAERGFAGTSLQDVADAMGMARPALYYYVRSKDELLARLVAETTEVPAAQIRGMAQDSDADATTRLRRVAHAIALSRATEPTRFRMLVRSEAELPPEVAEANRLAQRGTLRQLAGLIDEGVLSGEFRPVDARTTALAILGMCNWIAWWQQSLGSGSPDEVASRIANLAVAMVSQPAGRSTGPGGPAGAIALLRADLDFLERTLDAQAAPAPDPAAADVEA